MWFRIFVAGWSLVFLGLTVWLATYQSSEAIVFGRYSPAYFKLLVAGVAVTILSLVAHSSFFTGSFMGHGYPG